MIVGHVFLTNRDEHVLLTNRAEKLTPLAEKLVRTTGG